jgi:hypothetical protein
MQKSEWLHQMRITPFERQAVDLTAARLGLKTAEAVRHLIRQGAIEIGVWPLIDAPAPEPGGNGDKEGDDDAH